MMLRKHFSLCKSRLILCLIGILLPLLFPPAEGRTQEILTLQEAVETGIQQSFGVRRGVLGLELSKLDARSALIISRIKLNVNTTYNRIGPVQEVSFGEDAPPVTFVKPDQIRGSLDLLQPVDLFGVAKRAYRATLLQSSMKSLDLEIAYDITRAAIAQAYLLSLFQMKRVEISKEALELSEEQLRVAEAKWNAKVTPYIEVLQAEVAVSMAKEDLQSARAALDSSLNDLFLAMGVDPYEVALTEKGLPDIDSVAEFFNRTDPDTILEETFEMNLGHKKIAAGSESFRQLALASKNVPRINIIGNVAHQIGNKLQKEDSWGIGVGLSFPLFDSGDAKVKIEKFWNQREQLLVSDEELRKSLRSGLETIFDNFSSLYLNLNSSQKTLELSKEALRISEVGFKEGVVTRLELDNSRLRYLQARLNSFNNRIQILLTLEALKSLVGYDSFESKYSQFIKPQEDDSE